MRKTLELAIVCFVALATSWTARAVPDTWTTKSSTQVTRCAHASVVVNGKLYVLGGEPSYRASEVYDPTTDQWSWIEPTPWGHGYGSAAAVGGKIYLFDGWDRTRTAMYDPATDEWKEMERRPDDGVNKAVALTVGDSIYLVGARSADFAAGTRVFRYDTKKNSWDERREAPTLRGEVAACVANGKIYLLGGKTDMVTVTGLVEEYDPATDQWRDFAEMPTPRYWLTAVGIENRIYAIGGDVGGWTGETTVETLDLTTRTWSQASAMPTPRLLLTANAIGGRIYVIDGFSVIRGAWNYHVEVEEYDTGLQGDDAKPVAPNGKLPVVWGTLKSAR